MNRLLRNTLSSLAVVAVFVIAFWGISVAFGWEIALLPTLIGSLLLTLVLSLVVGGFRKRAAA